MMKLEREFEDWEIRDVNGLCYLVVAKKYAGKKYVFPLYSEDLRTKNVVIADDTEDGIRKIANPRSRIRANNIFSQLIRKELFPCEINYHLTYWDHMGLTDHPLIIEEEIE